MSGRPRFYPEQDPFETAWERGLRHAKDVSGIEFTTRNLCLLFWMFNSVILLTLRKLKNWQLAMTSNAGMVFCVVLLSKLVNVV